VQKFGSAFKGDPHRKEAYIERLLQAISQGDLEPGNFMTNVGGLPYFLLGYDFDISFEMLRDELGLPIWLLELLVFVFESLPTPQARSWAVSLLKAIPVGADVERIRDVFARDLLEDSEIGILGIVAGDARASAICREFVEALHHRAPYAASREELTRISRDALNFSLELLDTTRVPIRSRRQEIKRRYPVSFAFECLCLVEAAEFHRAVKRIISMHTPVISYWRALWIARSKGRSLVCSNFSEMFSSGRYSLTDDRYRYGELCADRILRIIVRRLSNGNAFKVEQASFAYRDGFQKYRVKHIPKPETSRIQLEAQTPFPNRIQRWLSHLAKRSVGYCGQVVGWALLLSAAFMSSYLAYLPERLFSLLGLFALGWLLISQSKQLQDGSGWYHLLDGKVAPVLLLRCFEDDDIGIASPHLGPWFAPANWQQFGRSQAERLSRALLDIGPLVSVRNPSGANTPGTAQINLPDDTWKIEIPKLMVRAALVVVMPGFRPGFRWELEACKRYVCPQRLLVFAPDEKKAQLVRYIYPKEEPSSTSHEISAFRCGLERLPHSYTAFLEDVLEGSTGIKGARLRKESKFMYFSNSWRPRVPPVICDDFIFEQYWSAYAAELAPVLERIGRATKVIQGAMMEHVLIVVGTCACVELLIVFSGYYKLLADYLYTTLILS
jgi:hypothetical protein